MDDVEFGPGCTNCGDAKCMDCRCRMPHPECVEDCPECCNLPLWDDDEYPEGADFEW